MRDHRLFVLFTLSLLIPLSAAQSKSATARTLSKPYQKWLDEDVRYLITDQEQAKFDTLATDQQRDKFVEDFWDNRNPHPGSTENAFKQEHYRRIAYANTNFAAGVPGYRTDRGHIYIVYGPPEEIEHHAPSSVLRHASEVWRYPALKEVGTNVLIKFVDTCDCGDYKVTTDPSGEKPPAIKQ